MTIPWETIDLDEDPAARWSKVVAPRAAAITEMIDVFIAAIRLKDGVLLQTILGLAGDVLLKKLPPVYAAELRGIHKATKINVGYLFVYNIMYELMGFCTSMVSQDAAGHIYHSRNLDFGLFSHVRWSRAWTHMDQR
eukprot:gene5397-2797_t